MTELTAFTDLPNIDEANCQKLLSSTKPCGIGYFGKVFPANWHGRRVAIKVFNKFGDLSRHFNELMVHNRSCGHPNIVKILAAGPNIPHHFSFYVMEFADCLSLNEILHNFRQVQYTLAHAVSWTLQAAQGADYLHRILSPPVCHGDIKPGNMLLFDRGQLVKLCDFGSAGTLSVATVRRPSTLVYTAPEITCLQSGMELQYSPACDVYSLTIAFWELLARRRPFQDSDDQLKRPSFWSVFNRRPLQLKDIPAPLYMLTESGWARNPIHRPSMYQVVELLTFALDHILLRNTALPTLAVPSGMFEQVVCQEASDPNCWPSEDGDSDLS